MRVHATGTPESRKLLSDLEDAWARVSDSKFSSSSLNGNSVHRAPSIYSQYVAPGGASVRSQAGASIVSSRRGGGGTAVMSEYGVSRSYKHGHGTSVSLIDAPAPPLGTVSLVSPTIAAAAAANGAAAASIAASRQGPGVNHGSSSSYTAFDDTNIAEVEMRNWKQDVTWALETINEEISAMRQRYLYAPLQGLAGNGATTGPNGSVNGASSASVGPSRSQDPMLQYGMSASGNHVSPPYIDHNYNYTNSNSHGGVLPANNPTALHPRSSNSNPSVSVLEKSILDLGYKFLKHIALDIAVILLVTRLVKWAQRKPQYLIRHPYIARLLRSAGSFLTFVLLKILRLDVRPL